MPIAYASSPLAPVPVTSIAGVRFASFTPGVHSSAARSFGLDTVSFGSAAPAGPRDGERGGEAGGDEESAHSQLNG